MRGSCWTRRSGGRSMNGCGTQIVAETRGNPLALLELPRGLSPAELAGGFGLPEVLPLPGRIEDSISCGGSRTCPGRPGCCWWSRPPNRPVIRCCCGGPPGGWESRPRPRCRRPRPGCSSSAPGCGSGIRWSARRPTGRRRCTTGRPCTAPWPRSPTRSFIRTAAPGTCPGRARARRAGRRRTRAVRRPGPDARGPGRSRRLSRARGGADAGPGAAGRPSAGRGRGQGPGRAPSTRTLELLDMAAAGSPDQLRHARADLVRAQLAFVSNRGRDAPPLLLRGGQAAGADRHRPGPRGLPGHDERRDVRGPPGRSRRRRAGGVTRGACGAAASAPAARVRSSPGWPGRPLQRGVLGRMCRFCSGR